MRSLQHRSILIRRRDSRLNGLLRISAAAAAWFTRGCLQPWIPLAPRRQKVEAVLEQPLFSADHKLILPEGTHVDGSVVVAKESRLVHRGGRLRFNFQNLELPEMATLLVPPQTSAPSQTPQVQEKEEAADPNTRDASRRKGDHGTAEGRSRGRRSGDRIQDSFHWDGSCLIGSQAAGDADHIRAPSSGGTRGAIIANVKNIGGRPGSGLGFGLLGTIAAQSSRTVGRGVGILRLAWSVFSTVVARAGSAIR